MLKIIKGKKNYNHSKKKKRVYSLKELGQQCDTDGMHFV